MDESRPPFTNRCVKPQRITPVSIGCLTNLLILHLRFPATFSFSATGIIQNAIFRECSKGFQKDLKKDKINYFKDLISLFPRYGE